MTDDGGTIIHLFGAPPAIDGTPAVAEREGCWKHQHWPVVDDVSRTVDCARCKKRLDPIDVLIEVAHRHQAWARLREETSTMRKELESMKAEEKRVKARTKSHRNKDALEAVATERRKADGKRLEILRRTDDIARAARRIDQLLGKRDGDRFAHLVDTGAAMEREEPTEEG